MNKNIRRLPDSELEVMQAIWACSPRAGENTQPVSRGQIEEVLQDAEMAATTLLTLLSRLTDKGFVQTEKIGRSNVYTPLISQADYLASQSRSFLNKLCGGSLSTFASALCDSGLTKEELEELRQLLERNEL
ncbi:MAG: BlaI/MecI/CopY family transcriptional regulator [Firmicutes bacterium]|nr:BlaI/MecI/CopY family transcriptional regulator [Bacillota bacterium]